MSRVRYNDFFNQLVSCLYWQSSRSEDLTSFETLARKFGVEYETGFLAEAQRELKSKGLLRGPDPIDGDATALGRLTGAGLRFAEDRGLDDLAEDEREIASETDADELNQATGSFQSASWTGLPTAFELTEAKRQTLVRDLELAEDRLVGLGLSQEIQAQARAYFVAARILAEAPEPPADIIWNIIGRANSLSGIASLLLSIVALFN